MVDECKWVTDGYKNIYVYLGEFYIYVLGGGGGHIYGGYWFLMRDIRRFMYHCTFVGKFSMSWWNCGLDVTLMPQYLFIYLLFIYCHLYSAFSIVQCSNALYRL